MRRETRKSIEFRLIRENQSRIISSELIVLCSGSEVPLSSFSREWTAFQGFSIFLENSLSVPDFPALWEPFDWKFLFQLENVLQFRSEPPSPVDVGPFRKLKVAKLPPENLMPWILIIISSPTLINFITRKTLLNIENHLLIAQFSAPTFLPPGQTSPLLRLLKCSDGGAYWITIMFHFSSRNCPSRARSTNVREGKLAHKSSN